MVKQKKSGRKPLDKHPSRGKKRSSTKKTAGNKKATYQKEGNCTKDEVYNNICCVDNWKGS